jgi:NIMA (never in mitosis gene a)-related kinase 1/4/5
VLGDTYSLAETVIGTPYYMSPELCESAPYNYKSDVWAMGCVLYELAALKHAFDGSNMCALVLKILRGRYDPLPDSFSPDLRDLVDSMLQSVVCA